MIGDLYLVTLFSTFRSQQLVNTFTYVQREAEPVGKTNAEALADGFELEFLAVDGNALRNAWISDQVDYQSLRVQNLFSPVDYYELSFASGTDGGATGDALPNYVSYSYRTQWLGGVVRRGFKRFAGVPETVNENGVIAAAAVTTLQALEGSLESDIEESGSIYRPCIVKRIPYVTSGGSDAYRLPENAGEAVFVEGLTWQLQLNLTTQNSRKIGRGI